MLTIEEVAAHYGLNKDTVRRHIKSGALISFTVNGRHRMTWPDVWCGEAGPRPSAKYESRYRLPLLSKKAVASALCIGQRSVERWIEDGLPTRNVFGNVRVNPEDLGDWLRRQHGTNLPPDWWVQ